MSAADEVKNSLGFILQAMSAMRKRKMAQNRVDKLTGSMDLLDDVLYRIKQAESNEMVCISSLCFRVHTG